MNLSNIDQFRRSLKDHALTLLQTGLVTAYRLGKPGTRMMGTLILFTPEGIALMGDLTPEDNGTVSVLGYGVDWFAGELSPDYLCSKFLRRRWVKELAQDQLHDETWLAALGYDAGMIQKVGRLAGQLDDHGPEWLRDELDDIGFDISDGIPGHGYDPVEAGWLVAIQERFAALYAELRAATVAGGAS